MAFSRKTLGLLIVVWISMVITIIVSMAVNVNHPLDQLSNPGGMGTNQLIDQVKQFISDMTQNFTPPKGII